MIIVMKCYLKSNVPVPGLKMGSVTTKPVFGVSDKVIFKLVCSATETARTLNFACRMSRHDTFH